MKRKIFILLIFTLLMTEMSVYSQEYRPRRVEFTVYAGPSISWAQTLNEGYRSGNARLGGVYGLDVDVNLVPTAENYYFTIGLAAKHVMTKMIYPDKYADREHHDSLITAESITSKFNNIYLSIPTAIEFKTNPFGRFVIDGVIGLEHSICVSAKSKDEVTRADGTSFKVDKVDRYKEMSLIQESLYVEFGFEYVIRDNTKATFGLAYNCNFNNMFRRKTINQITQERVRSRLHSFEFLFGFVF